MFLSGSLGQPYAQMMQHRPHAPTHTPRHARQHRQHSSAYIKMEIKTIISIWNPMAFFMPCISYCSLTMYIIIDKHNYYRPQLPGYNYALTYRPALLASSQGRVVSKITGLRPLHASVYSFYCVSAHTCMAVHACTCIMIVTCACLFALQTVYAINVLL